MNYLRKIWSKIYQMMTMSKDDIQKSEKDLLEENLDKLLFENPESIVISIKGSWGIGKSYFWHKYSRKFNEGEYAYVSLFGKTTLSDIKRDIICQISASSKIIQKINGFIGSSKYLGLDVSSALSILSKTDFKNITICFDDFERVSKEVDIKDVIGLISELKEQKECKIVIINNIDQLEDSDSLNDRKIFKKKIVEGAPTIAETKFYISNSNNKESFELFSEKIIDYNFTYNPTIKENFLILKDNIDYFDIDLVLHFLESTNTNDRILKNFNIRILKKLINNLNLFNFLSDHEITKEIKDNILAYIFEQTYDKKIDLYDFNKIDISSLHNEIETGIEKSFLLNKNNLLSNIKKIESTIEKREIYNKIHELYDKFNFDLEYSSSDFSSELFEIFQENVGNIIKMLGFENFTFYINLLTEIDQDNAQKKKDFLTEASKKFIDSQKENENSIQNMLHKDFEDKFGDFPDVKDYLKKVQHDLENKITGDSETFLELLKKPIQKSGWSAKDEEIISSVTTASHKKFMSKSKEYLEASFQFARWTKSFAGSKPFGSASDRILEAMKQLAADSPDYSIKLRYIIKSLEQ